MSYAVWLAVARPALPPRGSVKTTDGRTDGWTDGDKGGEWGRPNLVRIVTFNAQKRGLHCTCSRCRDATRSATQQVIIWAIDLARHPRGHTMSLGDRACFYRRSYKVREREQVANLFLRRGSSRRFYHRVFGVRSFMLSKHFLRFKSTNPFLRLEGRGMNIFHGIAS